MAAETCLDVVGDDRDFLSFCPRVDDLALKAQPIGVHDGTSEIADGGSREVPTTPCER